MAAEFDLAGELAAAARGSAAGDRDGAWRFIRRYAEAWAAPLAAGDGCPPAETAAAEARLGLRLPPAMREAYGLLGCRADLIAAQDPLLRPGELYADTGVLVHRVESQRVVEWGIALADLARSDPPVMYRYTIPGEDAWRPFLGRFSLACVELVLSETAVAPIVSPPAPPVPALADQRPLDGDTAALVERRYAPLPVGPCPRGRPLRFWYAGPDLLLLADHGPGLLLVRARTAGALDAARRALPGGWLTGPG